MIRVPCHQPAFKARAHLRTVCAAQVPDLRCPSGCAFRVRPRGVAPSLALHSLPSTPPTISPELPAVEFGGVRLEMQLRSMQSAAATFPNLVFEEDVAAAIGMAVEQVQVREVRSVHTSTEARDWVIFDIVGQSRGDSSGEGEMVASLQAASKLAAQIERHHVATSADAARRSGAPSSSSSSGRFGEKLFSGELTRHADPASGLLRILADGTTERVLPASAFAHTLDEDIILGLSLGLLLAVGVLGVLWRRKMLDHASGKSLAAVATTEDPDDDGYDANAHGADEDDTLSRFQRRHARAHGRLGQQLADSLMGLDVTMAGLHLKRSKDSSDMSVMDGNDVCEATLSMVGAKPDMAAAYSKSLSLEVKANALSAQTKDLREPSGLPSPRLQSSGLQSSDPPLTSAATAACRSPPSLATPPGAPRRSLWAKSTCSPPQNSVPSSRERGTANVKVGSIAYTGGASLWSEEPTVICAAAPAKPSALERSIPSNEFDAEEGALRRSGQPRLSMDHD